MAEYLEHQYELHGHATLVSESGEEREVLAVVTYSRLGMETWLYVDEETGELLHAERIDGSWYDLDLDEAREEFADVIYAM